MGKYEVEETVDEEAVCAKSCTKKERDTAEGWDTWEELLAISRWEIEENSEPLPT